MIIIGLGSGRSGTASLARLLNSQHGATCFHELNPSCVRFTGTIQPVLNTVGEFQKILDGGDPSRLTADLSRSVSAEAYDTLCGSTDITMLGDIAHYYLRYVEPIAAQNPNVRFVCLKRDRQVTVQSWLNKTSIHRWPSRIVADRIGSLITRTRYYVARNPWMEHDGSIWAIDPVWDKCFPKFPGPTRRAAAEQYWEYYYKEAERLARVLPDRFRIVQTEQLNDPVFQIDLLSFCGVCKGQEVFVDAHIHKS